MNRTKFYEGYEKLKTVGQGAFGTATLYRRLHDGQQVVIKEVYTLDMDNSEKKSALNEVEILSTLNHPNIIRYLGSFNKEESLIIIMEYADGGNLAQLINAKKNKNEIFLEKSILNIISQIVAAIAYMHSNKILHRDLKTANIFLNMNGTVKVGDFGISKMLNTRSQAQTVVGTPYYLSPEMCEGSDYNEKSDIWAIGCILYELASLRKPFEAPTLPVLVQKIALCEYEDIPPIYSEDLAQLVRAILQKNIFSRPSAKYIHDSIIPKILKKIKLKKSNTSESPIDTTHLRIPKERSILYQINNFGDDLRVIPLELPHKKIINYSISSTHSIVITSDNTVYTWGENTFGQLALGDGIHNKKYSICATFLRGQKISKCAAGNGFSIFLSEDGVVYSCGDGRLGCLGHGDWNSLSTPKILDSLKLENIKQICRGDDHVVALSSEGKVLTWGCSRDGQLGQGHTQNRCKPLAIKLPNSVKIKNIFCGGDSTALLTTTGQIMVCGRNNYNKLGVLQQTNIILFTLLRSVKERIKYVSIGVNHTMMLAENGTIVAMGRNAEGQLGKGNQTSYNEPQVIRLTYKITSIASGLNYTIVVDNNSVLWFWGSTYKVVKNLSSSSSFCLSKSNTVIPLNNNKTVIIKEFGTQRNCDELYTECIRDPQSILALYSSPENVKCGNIIQLQSMSAKLDDLFVLVHTTAPPPVQQFTNNELHDTHFELINEDVTTNLQSSEFDLPNTSKS